MCANTHCRRPRYEMDIMKIKFVITNLSVLSIHLPVPNTIGMEYTRIVEERTYLNVMS